MISKQRARFLLRIALPIAAVIILFFSGVFRIEDYFASVPGDTLTASVIPAKVVSLTNNERTTEGLAPLTVSPLLTQAAQLKAEDMAEHSYYAHVSPDGRTPLYWLDRVGYRYLNAGENLVIDRTSSEQAVDAWMHSADHRENILRPQFTEIGVGVAAGTYKGTDTIYVVQEFATPYPTLPAPRTPIKTPAVAPAKPVVKVTVPVTPKPVATTSAPTPAVVVQATTSLVLDVPKLVNPIIRSLTVATTTPVTATSTATTTIATTSSQVLFSLPPEFFKPVSMVTIQSAPAASATPVSESEVRRMPIWVATLLANVRYVANSVPRLWD